MEFGGYYFHQKCHAGIEVTSLDSVRVGNYLESYLVHPAPTCGELGSGLDRPDVQNQILKVATASGPRIGTMFETADDELKKAKISANSVKCPVYIRTCLFLEQHDMLSSLTSQN